MVARDKQATFLNQLSGFRRGCNTTVTVLDLFNYVERERSYGNITIARFLDMRRAFGTVSHVPVLKSLMELNVSGRVLHWLRDFFVIVLFFCFDKY